MINTNGLKPWLYVRYSVLSRYLKAGITDSELLELLPVMFKCDRTIKAIMGEIPRRPAIYSELSRFVIPDPRDMRESQR